MKILAIRIRNLASLDGVTEIDFSKEPLKSAGIFAITGPTGAGKSTILDALCLALYAKTPRYSQAIENVNILDVEGAAINQKDVRAILRDGTAEGAAEVDFVGVDGNHYKAGWHVRRAGGKADGKLQADTIQLENITTRTIIPGKKRETLDDIERLVGLSFEQFTRSVLLAQGDFTAFLKAGKDEKASLLEKLTGIRIYSEISMLVFEKNKQATQELQLLKQEIGNIHLLAEEDILDYREQEQVHKGQIEAGEKELAGWQKEIEWWEQQKSLTEHASQAELHYQNATNARKEAAERENKLQLVEAVQKTRSWIDNLAGLKQQLTKTASDILLLKENLEISVTQKNQTQKAVETAEALLLEKKQQEAAATPLLEKALQLDVLLKERNELITNQEKELENITNRYQLLVKQLEASEQNMASISETISKQAAWQHANQQRETIAENVNLIVSKLSDAITFIQDATQKDNNIATEQKEIEKLTTEKATLQTQRQNSQKETEAISGEFNKLSGDIQATNIDQLETDLRTTENAIENYRQAAESWKNLYRWVTEYDLQYKKLNDYRSQRQEIETLLKKANEELKTAQTKKQTSEELLKNALLQASENIERLRDTLEDDKPCPVCGSTEHPYSKHHPALQSVLKTLEEAHASNEKLYSDGLKTFSAIQQKSAETETRIRETAEGIAVTTEKLNYCRNDWNKHLIQDDNFPKDDAGKTDWLDRQLQTQQQQKLALQGQFDEVQAKRKKLENIQERLITIQKETNHIINEEKDAERLLSSATEAISRLQQEKQKLAAQLATIEELLSPYFSGREWVDNWKSNPVHFVQRIKDFASQWKINKETKEKAERDLSILSAAIEKEKIISAEEKQNITAKQNTLEAIRSDTKKIQSERFQIFEGNPVKQVEQSLEAAVISAENVVTDKKKELEQLRNSYTRLTTQLEELSKASGQQEKQQTIYEEQIVSWLDHYNHQNSTKLSVGQLETLLTHTIEWMEQERHALKGIEDHVTRTHSVFEERKRTLTQHGQKRMSDKTVDALIQLSNTVDSKLTKEKDQLNEVRLRLRQDEENRKKAGRIQKTINDKLEQAENWSKLNELIGSADGKKFRQVAQEYTLEILIAYANEQLNSLSKRYSLQRIPDSLSLQVIDKDMGDEIRTIYSLSGGESFLVSLALALALASFSSNQVQVESLFIDEGFGSLDPITLTTVMDALDRLHNQGRKVGVISHVEEMTERIPVQIRVMKLSNGRSKVDTDSKFPLF